MDKDEFTAWYGGWAPRTPQDVAALFEGYAGTWWLAGGWAIEAFTGVPREHRDIDPSILLGELDLFRTHVAGRFHPWTATTGGLKPLMPSDPGVLPEGCGQLWLRRSALEPWEYDVLLAPGDPETWVYKRDPSVTMPMAEALWEREGVRYLQPEIQLLYKAKGRRPQDQADFDSALPHLDTARRGWLANALARTLPDHPWLDHL